MNSFLVIKKSALYRKRNKKWSHNFSRFIILFGDSLEADVIKIFKL